MKSPASRRPQGDPPGGPHALPIGERFVLWALRQWRCELGQWDAGRTPPAEESILRRGFRDAGLIEALPEFAIAMDAVLLGIRRAMEIHPPTSLTVSRDEAVLVALCGLAQSNLDRPLEASLAAMLEPCASQVAAARLQAFAAILGAAGLDLVLHPGDAAGRLH